MGESDQLVLQHYISHQTRQICFFTTSEEDNISHCQKILIQALVYTGLQEFAGRFVFALHLELFTVFVSLVFVIWQSLRGTV